MRILKPSKPSSPSGKQAALHAAMQGDLFGDAQDILDQNLTSDATAFGKGKNGAFNSRQRCKQKFNMHNATAKGSGSKVDLVDSKTKELNRLRNKAIRLLAMREHSCKEIENKLSIGDPKPSYVKKIIAELVENNYLSDHRFTENYVRSKQKRGLGPSRISAELKNKGIENSVIDEYLQANSSVWFDCARTQYQKKYGTDPVVDYNAWAKRARFLQGRGFGMGHIQAALPTIINR